MRTTPKYKWDEGAIREAIRIPAERDIQRRKGESSVFNNKFVDFNMYNVKHKYMETNILCYEF